MRRNCDSIEKSISKNTVVRTLFEKVVSLISLSAYADETNNETGEDPKDKDQSDNPGETQINYEDLISKARKEEKEKQYGTIEKLKKQIGELTKQHNSDLLKIADLEGNLQSANEKLSKTEDGDSETVKTLKAEISALSKSKGELEEKISEFEKNKPASRDEIEAEVRASLEEEYALKAYKLEKMAEFSDKILVPELVGGSTKEDIDASIQAALNRSKEIEEKLGKKNTSKRTPKALNNPSVSPIQDTQYSLDYLASLDPASKEYAEVRKQLGLH